MVTLIVIIIILVKIMIVAILCFQNLDFKILIWLTINKKKKIIILKSNILITYKVNSKIFKKPKKIYT